jgi:hypothetical protein
MARFTHKRLSWVKRLRRVAGHRFEEARFLLDKGNYTTGAAYLGGYAVECALKALILSNDPPSTDPEETIAEFVAVGGKGHNFDFLIGQLRTRGVVVPSTVLTYLAQLAGSTMRFPEEYDRSTPKVFTTKCGRGSRGREGRSPGRAGCVSARRWGGRRVGRSVAGRRWSPVRCRRS